MMEVMITSMNYFNQFIEFLSDFDDDIKPRTLTINSVTMGIQETKTIKQRICFNISEKNNKC